MSFHLIVAEHALVALLILVDKASWRNLTDKAKSNSVDNYRPFHPIKVLKVEIHSLTREIVIALTTFLNTSLKR